MPTWSSQGDILRWWRTEVLGLSQQDVAQRLSVKPSALSNWERGARNISINLERLDELLDGDGVLEGLLWSFGTPKGIRPRHVWTYVYPGASTPVWLWFRSPTARIDVIGEWGVARMEPTFDLGPNGAFVTLSVSVGESPIVIALSEPGWVDFGRGRLPPSIPGAEVVSAVDLLLRSSASGTFMDLFVGNLAGRLRSQRSKEMVTFAAMAPRILGSFVSRRYKSRPDKPAEPEWPPALRVRNDDDRAKFATLRHSRGLSLADVVDLLVKQTDLSISKETLRRFETDVGQPHDRLLPAALDQVLDAAGTLAVEELRRDRGEGLISYPRFWRGPVWLSFEGPAGQWPVTLRWGDWDRTLTVEPPGLFWFTCSTPEAPVRVVADDALTWSGGLGMRAGAVSIHQNWSPATIDVARRALGETERAFVRALQLRQGGEGP